jgi:hypothetical protein
VSRPAQQLARSLEATLVRPVALAADVERLVDGAQELLCAAVVVLPPLVATARARLGRAPIHVVAAVGLPFGAEGAKATAAACAQAVADGADVLDVVASLPLLANGDFPARATSSPQPSPLLAAPPPPGGTSCAGGHRDCYLEPAAWRLAARLVASAGLRRRRLRDRSRPEGATPAAIPRCGPSCPQAAWSRLRAASGRWPTRSARWTPALTCWRR